MMTGGGRLVRKKRSQLRVGREGDSPESIRSRVLLDELDAVGLDAVLHGIYLCDDAGGDLATPSIIHQHGSADQQFAAHQDSRAMLV